VLYRKSPEQALPPAAEYRRWREQDKAGEQSARVAAKVTSTDARRAVMADRFRTRDILGDEEGGPDGPEHPHGYWESGDYP
jgi:hypothetical protein